MENLDNNIDIALNIIFIGDSSVGKTSLITKYVDNKFSENIKSTLGIEYKDKIEYDEKREIHIRLKLNDTSGQERFRSITKNYYRDSHGIFFVFDVTNKESFENIQNWLIESKESKLGFKSILIGNKIDQIKKEEINKIEEKVKAYADKKGMKYFLVSAKDGTKITEMFNQMIELILEGQSVDEIKKKYSDMDLNESEISQNTTKKLKDTSDTKKKKKDSVNNLFIFRY